MGKLLNILLLASLFTFGESITRITYNDAGCNSINALEKLRLSECRLMSLGGQLFSVKIDTCNNTNWKTFVYFNSVNCSEPHDLISNGPSNTCFLSDSNLYEKILCVDIIGEQLNAAHSFVFLFTLFIMSFILLIL